MKSWIIGVEKSWFYTVFPGFVQSDEGKTKIMNKKKVQTRISQGKKNLYMMLMELGSIYKSDASLYMGYILGNRIAGAEVIQNAKKNGLLAVRTISSDRTKKQYPVITTTHA